MIDPAHAALLGAVEGLTEFLPVSSTGHLILVSHLLGLRGDAVKTFEIVIQAGALGAVVSLYRARVGSMGRGWLGRDALGRRLALNLLRSFLPTAAAGMLLHRVIKTWLFSVWPVVSALALGGVLMIGLDRWVRRHPPTTKDVTAMSAREALLIGCAQCLSLWPGMSRAMVTIMAAVCLGFPAAAAAEYSLLLALPTLGAATLFDAVRGRVALFQDIGGVSVACGLLTAAAMAALTIHAFLRYLTHRGLAPFGWYRLALAALVWATVPRG